MWRLFLSRNIEAQRPRPGVDSGGSLTGGEGAGSEGVVQVLNATMWRVADIWDPVTHGRPHRMP
eukprot:COSAG01_NODE_2366_length_7816_cov_3.797460_7_plen_64_part_00